jgi:hypothetical protein
MAMTYPSPLTAASRFIASFEEPWQSMLLYGILAMTESDAFIQTMRIGPGEGNWSRFNELYAEPADLMRDRRGATLALRAYIDYWLRSYTRDGTPELIEAIYQRELNSNHAWHSAKKDRDKEMARYAYFKARLQDWEKLLATTLSDAAIDGDERRRMLTLRG